MRPLFVGWTWSANGESNASRRHLTSSRSHGLFQVDDMVDSPGGRLRLRMRTGSLEGLLGPRSLCLVFGRSSAAYDRGLWTDSVLPWTSLRSGDACRPSTSY